MKNILPKDIIPKDKKKLIPAVVIALSFIIFIFFIYIPQHSKVNRLKQEARSMQEQIDLSKAMLGDLSRLANVLAQMQQELSAFENRIPATKHMSSILSEVPKLANAYSVEVISIDPDNPKQAIGKDKKPITLDGAPLMGIEVDLQLKATYKALAEYLNQIQESIKILATIDEIIIRKDEDEAPLLDINLIVTVYALERD